MRWFLLIAAGCASVEPCELLVDEAPSYASGPIVAVRAAGPDRGEAWLSVDGGPAMAMSADTTGWVRAVSLQDGPHAVSVSVRRGERELCVVEGDLRVATPVPTVLRSPGTGEVFAQVDGVLVVVEAAVGSRAELVIDGARKLRAPVGSDGALALRLELDGGAHTLAVRTVEPETGFEHDVEARFVVDGAPSIPTVALAPASPVRGAPLVAVVVDDAVDDETPSLTYSFAWYLDGTLQADLTGPVVPGDRLIRGQSWRVEVRARDALQAGPAAEASAVVADAPSFLRAVSVSPEMPSGDVTLTCRADIEDADGDAAPEQVAWLVDGAPVAAPAVWSSTGLVRGQQVACEATVAGASLRSEDVTLVNAPPSVTLQLTPDPPIAGQAVRCEAVARDVDGDPTEVRRWWEVGGAYAGDGESIEVGRFAQGERLACVAEVSDPEVVVGPVRRERTVISAPTGNVLVVVWDDVGAYDLSLYDATAGRHTPNLEALAGEGLTFDRAWSMPICGPSRAAALTGRYAFRTGFGDNIQNTLPNGSLEESEVTIAEQVRDASMLTYATAAIGKWHLSSWPDGGGARVLDQGFGTYRGALGNLYDNQTLDGRSADFFNWEKTIDTVTSRRVGYITVDETDDAISLMSSLQEPWVIWLAYHAAHEPFHEPDASALPFGPSPVPDTGQRELFAHMIESLDIELGRLLAFVPADTHVIVLGDNGAPKRVRRPGVDEERAKSTVYEGGVRVPMVVRSPRVTAPGERTDALVHVVDIFPTVAELTLTSTVGLDLDGVSLGRILSDAHGARTHDVLYTERFEPLGYGPYTLHERAIRDEHYKLVRHTDGSQELYLLEGDLQEGVDLAISPAAADQAALLRLSDRLDRYDVR